MYTGVDVKHFRKIILRVKQSLQRITRRFTDIRSRSNMFIREWRLKSLKQLYLCEFLDQTER